MERKQGINRNHALRGGSFLAASLLLAMVALGCGEQKQQAAAEPVAPGSPGSPGSGVAAQPADGAPPAVTASATGTVELGTSNAEEGLPPDVAAAAPDTLTVPGSVVVITALGSADVTSVTLNDGAGEKTPFTYDSESNLWRVSYRVPVRVTADRIGLSVTASTDANRWKRVWVFLKLRDTPDTGERTEADSEPGC
jgi:hypothetical protein